LADGFLEPPDQRLGDEAGNATREPPGDGDVPGPKKITRTPTLADNDLMSDITHPLTPNERPAGDAFIHIGSTHAGSQLFPGEQSPGPSNSSSPTADSDDTFHSATQDAGETVARGHALPTRHPEEVICR